MKRTTCLSMISVLLTAVAVTAVADGTTFIDIVSAPTGAVLYTTTLGYTGRVHVIEATTDLAGDDWWPVHAETNDIFGLAAPDADILPLRYFRTTLTEPPLIGPSADWKTGIVVGVDAQFDSFFSDKINNDPQTDPGMQCWVKFHVLMDDLTRVYFQNEQAYNFHYQFAVNELSPFALMDHDAYTAATLFNTSNREAILGTVIAAPNAREYAIQFVGADELPRCVVRFLYETVDATITRGDGYDGFYMPTTEQAGLALSELAYFDHVGIEIAAADRWASGEGVYSDGWTLGRLVYVASTNIDTAYAQGDLLPTDILITDEMPAEVPYVAGIITLAPTTPNSHVVILANAYDVPFLYLSDSNDVAWATSLTNRDVMLSVFNGWTRVIDADAVDQSMKNEIVALHDVPPLEVNPIATFGSYSTNVAGLWPSDIIYFGGKAANYGFLRRTVPDNSREAMAFSFDLWNDYMDQMVNSSNTLREAISNLLSHYTYPPADVQQLDDDLETVRDLIKDTADFNTAQSNHILTALSAMFTNTEHKIRFRSSTNVEDSDKFSGAGLYESYSGCLLDDLDGDDIGPSHCDTNQPNERGVFRAMRKVYASFYKMNPFLERLRRGVNENHVGMAILVHHNFPDPEELANGVATCAYDIWDWGPTNANTSMVSQPGDASVTNPEGTEQPEIVSIEETVDNSTNLSFQQRSDLLPLGETYVMSWEDDYREFNVMFLEVAAAFYNYHGREFTLDFEYKKMTPDDLILKQVRELPVPSNETYTVVGLLNEPGPWRVQQGGFFGTPQNAGVCASHRLKSEWQIAVDNRWLDSTGRASSVFTQTDWDFLLDGSNESWTGVVSGWPGATFTNGQSDLFNPTYRFTDSWDVVSTDGTIKYSLILEVPQPAHPTASNCPVFVPADLHMELHATYPVAMPKIENAFPSTTMVDVVYLEPSVADPPVPDVPILRERLTTTGGVTVAVSYYWPLNPLSGGGNGYTAPLLKWGDTTITGLTTDPIELHGHYSRTYQSMHHNNMEDFLFEPALEAGISSNILSELEAADIKQIYIFAQAFGDQWQTTWKIVGLNGMVRDFP